MQDLTTIEVCCAIIENGDKILVTQRSEAMTHPLKWEFPGGKIEKGEDSIDCIIREIREELGLEVEVTRVMEPYTHSYHDKRVKLIPHICKIVGGKFNSREHSKVLWDTASNTIGLDWVEADVPILNNYLRYKVRGHTM